MEKQGLNELAAAVHENAVAHGWWEQERELPEILMLCVSELAEALEEYRAGKPNIYYNVEGGRRGGGIGRLHDPHSGLLRARRN